jgi:ergothioneine biosynthesis protein EgtB
VSPPKWHLAHTTWFFEVFLLEKFVPNYKPYHSMYYFLFNSYYHTFGERWDRPQRGALSRPTVAEIYTYREAIDERMTTLLNNASEKQWNELWPLIVLGLHHEQQHQELLVMDIKYILAANPLMPVYQEQPSSPATQTAQDTCFVDIEGGLYAIGFQGNGFFYDNESPVHKVFVNDFSVQNRLVNNGEYFEFVQDGGYENSLLWLADGWAERNSQQWRSPLYWFQQDGEWFEKTLHGPQKLKLDEPVCHISFYEAEAFASWKGMRLLTEQEWEIAASLYANDPAHGNFWDDQCLHPGKPQAEIGGGKIIHQMHGDLWEWTNSAYLPYPGYKQQEGALGEYNGKFMSNQMVLRGGCCATARDHIRLSYRNFYQPDKRWPFTGIRLAQK